MCRAQTAPSATLPILAACIAVFALGQFQRAAGGVFGPVLTERIGLSPTALGLLVGAVFLANLVTQAPAGVALDRHGPRRVLCWPQCIIRTWIHGRRGSAGGYGVVPAALAAARMRLTVGSETL